MASPMKTVNAPQGEMLAAYVPGNGWLADQNWSGTDGEKDYNTNLSEMSNADYTRQRDAQMGATGNYELGSAKPYFSNVNLADMDLSGLTAEERASFNPQAGRESGGFVRWGDPNDPNIGRPEVMAREKFKDRGNIMEFITPLMLAAGPVGGAIAGAAGGAAAAGAAGASEASAAGIGASGAEALGLPSAGASASPFYGDIPIDPALAGAEAALSNPTTGTIMQGAASEVGPGMMPPAGMPPAIPGGVSEPFMSASGNVAYGTSAPPMLGDGAAGALGLGTGMNLPTGAGGGGGGGGGGGTDPYTGMPSGSEAAGGATPAAGTAASTSSRGFVDTLLEQMKKNALGLGMMGASALMGTKKGGADLTQLQELAAAGSAQAKQLLAQYQSGTLSAGQQANIDQLVRNTKNQLAQYFAGIGQSDSTAARQALAQVDQTALQMKQQMLDSSLQAGLSAIGVASGPLNSIAQYQLSQDNALRQAFGNFAQGVGTLFGRGAGEEKKPATTGTTASAGISLSGPR